MAIKFMRIRDCEIRRGKETNEIYVTYYNDHTEKLCSYNNTICSFDSSEFLGLTHFDAFDIVNKRLYNQRAMEMLVK